MSGGRPQRAQASFLSPGRSPPRSTSERALSSLGRSIATGSNGAEKTRSVAHTDRVVEPQNAGATGRDVETSAGSIGSLAANQLSGSPVRRSVASIRSRLPRIRVADRVRGDPADPPRRSPVQLRGRDGDDPGILLQASRCRERSPSRPQLPQSRALTFRTIPPAVPSGVGCNQGIRAPLARSKLEALCSGDICDTAHPGLWHGCSGFVGFLSIHREGLCPHSRMVDVRLGAAAAWAERLDASCAVGHCV